MANDEIYDMLVNLVKRHTSVRKSRSDPIPAETIDKILDVIRYLYWLREVMVPVQSSSRGVKVEEK